MKVFVCLALILVLTGPAVAQRRRSPSPSPTPSPSPSPDNETAAAVEATPDNTTTAEPAPDAAAGPTAPGSKTNITDKRIKAFYDTPAAAAQKIPELKELSALIAASPAVSKLLSDKDLTTTIFAPNNAAVKAALQYVDTNFPNMTTKELSEMGIIDGLLQYHVTAGKAALTDDRLKNGMKLTMLNGEPTTIVMKANATAGARRLLQEEESLFIRSNTNQTIPIVGSNYQGGKAIIHVIDGVLIPESLAANYSMTDIPGASNDTMDSNMTDAAGNETDATLPGAGNDTSKAGGADGAASGAAPASSPKPKSSAGIASAALLAVPTLLAVLLL